MIANYGITRDRSICSNTRLIAYFNITGPMQNEPFC